MKVRSYIFDANVTLKVAPTCRVGLFPGVHRQVSFLWQQVTSAPHHVTPLNEGKLDVSSVYLGGTLNTTTAEQVIQIYPSSIQRSTHILSPLIPRSEPLGL